MTFQAPRSTPGTRPERIVVNGITYSFVTRQRGDFSVIYKSEDKFIRIGNPDKIHRDLALHRKMEESGFPVATLLAEGEMNEEAYFIESSLGDAHFGDIFAADMQAEGSISSENFERFLSIAEQFAKAQLSTATAERDFAVFMDGILFSALCEELPEYAERLRLRFGKVRERVSQIPFVLTHGDFNPNNLYPTGVIDLEDSFFAPYGYDVVSAISHIDSFPDSHEYEFFAKYRFTTEQKDTYLQRLDTFSEKAGLPKLSLFREDLEFCRAIWLAAKIPHTPKLQRFRYDFVIQNFLT
ncbi:aminoglycoside phosphotransferase family protein [Patescibacteria group bacterium]|nr:aminoglycoside phosphotransferase family protein [Patescibacteria group bacterium]MBU1500836.1 aminoglycoside phosphotransferase family protein [Patescibacteria group bacterium]MBU2080891.1 aminoglycoside phosphotransferase family protein [Patescibacteria group bacterium]MBU2123996.1 aminoglycoside phosphotransferase family protein [Patescibacteria group bacterium]MBU2194713.1 aminoglycoside phosphotransferase family protein [Patescibacteria group bacterium]